MASESGPDGTTSVPHIRRATTQDVDLIAGFNQAMAKETEDIDIPQETAVTGVKGVLVEGGPAAGSAMYYVIEEAEQVVGQLMITLEWSDWRASHVWWIQSVYVRPECRGKGYFRKLYEHVRQDAMQQGVAGLRLYADDGNTPAHATYARLGMRSHYKVFEDMFTQY